MSIWLCFRKHCAEHIDCLPFVEARVTEKLLEPSKQSKEKRKRLKYEVHYVHLINENTKHTL